MTEKRYVLCRPVSGLNDTLCQFEICRAYAERHDRILVVDGRISAGVLAEFGDYFEMPGDRHIFRMTSPDLPNLESLDCYPPEVFGRIFTLNHIAHPDPAKRYGANVVDSDTLVSLRFDPKKDYSERLLLRQQWGAGIKSFSAVEHLTIVPSLGQRIRAAIDQLPPGYAALHIRNTDYRTDVAQVIRGIRKQVAGKDLLLCTDDAAAFDQVSAGLPDTRVHRLTVPAFDDGKPVHITAKGHGAQMRHRVASDAILDLCALAAGSTVFTAQILPTGKKTSPTKSGFSRLAEHLAVDKSRLRKFLGAAGNGMLPGIAIGECITIEG
jgi:hypothetical protein